MKGMRLTALVLDAQIDAIDWGTALERIARWAQRRESRYVCICNVHSIVTASQEVDFRQVTNAADMAAPDGAPVAWMLRRLGFSDQQRINGPDLMWRYCELAAQTGQAIYFYGNTEKTLDLLQRRLLEAFPGLHIAGALSPPFRAIPAW